LSFQFELKLAKLVFSIGNNVVPLRLLKVVPLQRELPARPHDLFWSCGAGGSLFLHRHLYKIHLQSGPSGRHDIKSGRQVRTQKNTITDSNHHRLKSLPQITASNHHRLKPSQPHTITASYQLHLFAQ
jgi:hypothetical protein